MAETKPDRDRRSEVCVTLPEYHPFQIPVIAGNSWCRSAMLSKGFPETTSESAKAPTAIQSPVPDILRSSAFKVVVDVRTGTVFHARAAKDLNGCEVSIPDGFRDRRGPGALQTVPNFRINLSKFSHLHDLLLSGSALGSRLLRFWQLL